MVLTVSELMRALELDEEFGPRYRSAPPVYDLGKKPECANELSAGPFEERIDPVTGDVTYHNKNPRH